MTRVTLSAPAALPRDDGLDRLLADPALGATAKTIAVAMVKNWAWAKDHCWPSDRTIAAKVGKSVGHVQRCLRQLESAGWVTRERTDAVPNGRRIWLRWRGGAPGAGAQPATAPAREAPPARARNKAIGIVNPGTEPTERPKPTSRQRPEPPPAPTSTPPSPTPTPAEPPPACRARPSAAATAPPRPTAPPPSPPSRPRRPGLGLTELAAAVAATSDPILAAELARRQAPPPAPEPPPEAWATAELLGRLPGRHDLILAAARRLSVETDDFRPASLRTFEAMTRAVVGRDVPPSVLSDCLRQAQGPRARHAGKVLVAAWKHAAAARARPGGP